MRGTPIRNEQRRTEWGEGRKARTEHWREDRARPPRQPPTEGEHGSQERGGSREKDGGCSRAAVPVAEGGLPPRLRDGPRPSQAHTLLSPRGHLLLKTGLPSAEPEPGCRDGRIPKAGPSGGARAPGQAPGTQGRCKHPSQNGETGWHADGHRRTRTSAPGHEGPRSQLTPRASLRCQACREEDRQQRPHSGGGETCRPRLEGAGAAELALGTWGEAGVASGSDHREGIQQLARLEHTEPGRGVGPASQPPPPRSAPPAPGK